MAFFSLGGGGTCCCAGSILYYMEICDKICLFVMKFHVNLVCYLVRAYYTG